MTSSMSLPSTVSELRQRLESADVDVEQEAARIITVVATNNVDNVDNADPAKPSLNHVLNLIDQAEHEVDTRIQSLVLSGHDSLLVQATIVSQLETHLEMLETTLNPLVNQSERLKSRISEPYRQLSNATTTLRNMQDVCDELRLLLRVVQLGKRVNNKDVGKAANAYAELHAIADPADIVSSAGDAPLQAEVRAILQAKGHLERETSSMLASAVSESNALQVSKALGLLVQLDVLKTNVNECVDQLMHELKDELIVCFDVRSIKSKALIDRDSSKKELNTAMTALSSTTNLTACKIGLWSNLESFFDFALATVLKVALLQKSLMEADKKSFDIMEDFWAKMCHELRLKAVQTAKNAAFVAQAFENEYNRLLRMALDFVTKAQMGIRAKIELKMDHNKFDEMRAGLVRCFDSFENVFLSKALERMFEPVNQILSATPSSQQKPPEPHELVRICERLSSELNLASDADTSGCFLLRQTMRNVMKTVQLVTVRLEQLLVMDATSTQLAHAEPVSGQMHNVRIVNLVFELHEELQQYLRPNRELRQDIEQLLHTWSFNALAPLVSSIEEGLMAVLGSISSESFVDRGDHDDSECVREAISFWARVRLDFLAPYKWRSAVNEHIGQMVNRICDDFVLRLSLLRPVDNTGINVLMRIIGDLKDAFHGVDLNILDNFAELIRTGQNEGLENSLKLHWLFSSAPESLLSPHDSVQWRLSRYIKWYNESSEEQRLQLIKGCLEGYSVQRKEGEEMHEVVDKMKAILLIQ